MKNLYLWLLVFVAVFFIGMSTCDLSAFAEKNEEAKLTDSQMIALIAAGPGKSTVLVRLYAKNTKGKISEKGHGSGITLRYPPKIGKSYVLTSFHVPQGSVAIFAFFLGQQRSPIELTLIGQDEKSDLALLAPKDPTVILPDSRFGDSDKLSPGDSVVAVGYPEDLQLNYFAGNISNPESLNVGQGGDCSVDSPTVLISDAKIAPGNSGGPLFNAQGEVVGVNTCITAFAAISISIPINYFTGVFRMLREGKRVKHPMLGVKLRDTFDMTSFDYQQYGMKPPLAQGIVIVDVRDKFPAARAGLRKGDIIAACEGVAPPTLVQFLKIIYFHLNRHKPITIVIHRDRATVLLVRIVSIVAANLQDEPVSASASK